MKNFIELIIGNLGGKHAWRLHKRRVRALPMDYRRAYRHIEHYLMVTGGGTFPVLQELVEMMCDAADRGLSVRELVGDDAAAFADALSTAVDPKTESAAERLNREIHEYFECREAAHG